MTTENDCRGMTCWERVKGGQRYCPEHAHARIELLESEADQHAIAIQGRGAGDDAFILGLEEKLQTAERAAASARAFHEKELAVERRKTEVLRLEIQDAAKRLAQAHFDLGLVRTPAAHVWRWQGDGTDDPASLACPVVMAPDTLRTLLAKDTGRISFDAGEDVAQARRKMGEQILATIENPGTTPLGAPGSIMRRAQEIGRRLANTDLPHEHTRTLIDLLACARSWESGVRVLGNVTASAMGNALAWVLRDRKIEIVATSCGEIEAPRVLYFGCLHGSGHFLVGSDLRTVDKRTLPHELARRLDTGFCPGIKRGSEVPSESQVQGIARTTHIDGHTVLAFWDRSIDHRGGSHSTFVIAGDHTPTDALALAKQQWPQVFARLKFPVDLEIL